MKKEKTINESITAPDGGTQKNPKPPKSANGLGSWRKNKSGNYELTITAEFDPITGKQKRKSFSGKTKIEARNKRDKYMATKINGTYVEPSKMTVKQWMDTWLNTYAKIKISEKSFDRYEGIINLHIIPNLGSIKIQNLKSEEIQNLYNYKNENGRMDGKEGGLSSGSIRYMHVIIGESLEKARKLGYIINNPNQNCELPKPIKNETKSFSEEELDKILCTLDLTNTYDVLIFADLASGIRQGEIISLTWSDFNEENKFISIDKSLSVVINRDENVKGKTKKIITDPKSNCSLRIVNIPDVLVSVLNNHKARLLNQGLIFGKDDTDLMFPSENCTLFSPRNVLRRWKNILNKAGVDYYKFHSIRHSYASLLNESGTDVKTVQAILGHANITTTSIYLHTSNENKTKAANTIGNIIKNSNMSL